MIGDPHWDNLWTAAQEMQLPVHFQQPRLDEGVALLPNALTPELAREIREASDAIFADPELRERHRHPVDFVIARLYNGPELFRSLLTREPIWSAVTGILGPGCEVVGLNTIRNPPVTRV